MGCPQEHSYWRVALVSTCVVIRVTDSRGESIFFFFSCSYCVAFYAKHHQSYVTSFTKCYVVCEKTNLAHARNVHLASMIVWDGSAQVFYCVLSADHVWKRLLYVTWSAASGVVPQVFLNERNRWYVHLAAMNVCMPTFFSFRVHMHLNDAV